MNRTARAAAAVLLALCFSSCGSDDTPAPAGERQREGASTGGLIVAVGDSLTAGLGLREEDAWPALMERRLRADGLSWEVVNAGVSGETSSGARSRISWILRMNPDIVVLETGANDGLRGLSTGLLKENLDAILTTLAEADVVVVLAGMRMVPNLGLGYTRRFARVYEDMAEKHNVVFIPFFLEGVAGEPTLNLPDGIHPNAAGQRKIMENAYPYLIEAIGKVRE